MPGKRSSPARSMRRKLARISSFTVLEVQPLARRAWRLVGRAPADIKSSGGMNRAAGGGGGPLALSIEGEAMGLQQIPPPPRDIPPGNETGAGGGGKRPRRRRMLTASQ